MIVSDLEKKYIIDSGKYLTEILYYIRKISKPGLMLIEIEEKVDNLIKKYNIKGAFKGYKGYPANLCLSLNDCLVHGVPDNTVIKEGDLLKVDLGIDYKGYITDAAISIYFGNDKEKDLIIATKRALDNALNEIVIGNNISKYSKAVYDYVRKKGFKIIENLTGHGVGKKVHENPIIYNVPFKTKEIFKKNMVIALEPITSFISKQAVYGKSKRNLYTEKGDKGAHWEYTILVSDNGPVILAGITEDVF